MWLVVEWSGPGIAVRCERFEIVSNLCMIEFVLFVWVCEREIFNFGAPHASHVIEYNSLYLLYRVFVSAGVLGAGVRDGIWVYGRMGDVLQ